VLRYFPGDEIGQCLREGLTLADPLLKLFAARSLLYRMEYVAPEDIEPIAADNETRVVLWGELHTFKMESLMPPKWAAPALLAASKLARWASGPHELGMLPEEVEPMKSFLIGVDGRMLEIFLFRFRLYPKPWEPGEGWMAGIAGPYRDGQILRSWSQFDTWSSKSPEEHFAKLYGDLYTCPTD
jgi:hypothetical protein